MTRRAWNLRRLPSRPPTHTRAPRALGCLLAPRSAAAMGDWARRPRRPAGPRLPRAPGLEGPEDGWRPRPRPDPPTAWGPQLAGLVAGLPCLHVEDRSGRPGGGWNASEPPCPRRGRRGVDEDPLAHRLRRGWSVFRRRERTGTAPRPRSHPCGPLRRPHRHARDGLALRPGRPSRRGGPGRDLGLMGRSLCGPLAAEREGGHRDRPRPTGRTVRRDHLPPPARHRRDSPPC